MKIEFVYFYGLYNLDVDWNVGHSLSAGGRGASSAFACGYVKDERTKQFAYSFHAAADRNGFVLGTIVTPGNIHDSQILEPLVE
jgi:hypothetical protein